MFSLFHNPTSIHLKISHFSLFFLVTFFPLFFLLFVFLIQKKEAIIILLHCRRLSRWLQETTLMVILFSCFLLFFSFFSFFQVFYFKKKYFKEENES